VASVMSVFAGAGIALAALGLFGLMAYMVAVRRREIGIRIALGAQMKDVLGLMLRKAMSLVLLGAIIGLAGAYAVTRLMSNLLFGVTPTDLVTFVAVPMILLLVALVACLIPARRATKVDPLVALRYE